MQTVSLGSVNSDIQTVCCGVPSVLPKFSSAGKGPFMDGKPKNIILYFSPGGGGGGSGAAAVE